MFRWMLNQVQHDGKGNRMLRRLILLSRCSGARDRERAEHHAGAGRRRPRAARRRGRARDPHAPSARLARLLAEPRRRRPADGRAVAAAEGLRRRPAALPGPDPARDRDLMNYVLRAGLCRARSAEGSGGRAPARSRSAPMRAGSPAPTRSAFPSRASFRSICRSATAPQTARSSTHGARRFPSRSPVSAISKRPETSCASRSRFRQASTSTNPIVFPTVDGPVDYDAKQASAARATR